MATVNYKCDAFSVEVSAGEESVAKRALSHAVASANWAIAHPDEASKEFVPPTPLPVHAVLGDVKRKSSLRIGDMDLTDYVQGIAVEKDAGSRPVLVIRLVRFDLRAETPSE